MPTYISRRMVAVCLSAFLLVGMAAPTVAYAYGNEGMFGGRPRPDYAVDFGKAAPRIQAAQGVRSLFLIARGLITTPCR